MSTGTALAAERILTELEGASQLAMSEKGDCLHVTVSGRVQRPAQDAGPSGHGPGSQGPPEPAWSKAR